jgi:SAM-dependent MidA family methyltransferase
MVYATPGTTSATVQAMLDLAQLPEPVRRVCEIGPGSGRYAERVIAAVNPNVYEIYETATDWLPQSADLARRPRPAQ